MSLNTHPDPLKESGAASKAKKKKNKKKGGGAGAEKKPAEAAVNGHGEGHDVDEDEDGEEDEPQSEPVAPPPGDEPDDVEDDQPLSPTTHANGSNLYSISSAVSLGLSRSRSQGALSPSPPPDASTRLDALAQERDTLRQEVTALRKSLESMQGKHNEEINKLKSEVEEATADKDHFETQYLTLHGRINTLKNTLGERLKADAAKLEEAHSQISDLEDQNRELQEANSTLTGELARLRKEQDSHESEISNLRKQASVSQQNWITERDELLSREAYVRHEFETAKQAMQDWEALAINERSLHDSLKGEMEELMAERDTLREENARALSERDQNSEAVDGLQKALQRLQTERRNERRELVEGHQSELARLQNHVREAEEAAQTAKLALETTQKELERLLPLEKEVKEKNLLIGKQRHELVTLNEHLTKALRLLKKSRPEDNVDRQLMSNYLIHFLGLDRSDPKKFEVLQYIAQLLNWDDEQREKAGLARPGASNSSLRIPLSPFRRTPSTPSLNSTLHGDPLLLESNSNSRESLPELWAEYLRRGAEEGDASRRGSQATATAPSPTSNSVSGLGITEQ